VPGSRPPRANFADIAWLDNGMGPLPMVSDVFDSTQIQLGQQPIPFYPNQTMTQLNPFPEATLPPLTCVPGQLSTIAVPKFTSNPNPPFAGVTVTLDGTASTPPTGPLQWVQVINPGDPIVTINNPTGAQATFAAPTVANSTFLTFGLVVGGQGSQVPPTAPCPGIGCATVTVPIIIPPPNTPPAVSATASFAGPPAVGPATTITVPSNASGVTLSATAVDPSCTAATCSMTFTWTQTGGTPVALASAAPDGSVQTFTTPAVPELTASQVFTFSLVATSATSSQTSTTPAVVTVIVQPVTDTIVVSNVVYRRTKGRLIINCSDFTPGVTLTATLDIINPATGLPFSGVMGPIIPFAQGVFSLRFSNIPPPNIVTITSDAGGMAQSGVTFLR